MERIDRMCSTARDKKEEQRLLKLIEEDMKQMEECTF
jgi:hypothetical protein